MSNFAPCQRIGDEVSKILKQSFSEKFPPWIRKIAMKIMSWYLQ